MAEPPILASRSAFLGKLAPVGASPAAVTACALPGLALAMVSARRSTVAPLAERVRELFDVELKPGPRRSGAGAIVFYGIAPGRWLMVARDQREFLIEEVGHSLEGFASVVDQSSGLAVLRLSGLGLCRVLEKGVPIDLDRSVFGAESVATTSVAHIGVTLWRTQGDDLIESFDMAVSRSYVGSFCRWLAHSSAEFGLDVGAPAGDRA